MDNRASIPGRVNDGISFCHRVQTGSGAHPASYPMGIRVSPIRLHGVILNYAMAWYLLKHKVNFTFTFTSKTYKEYRAKQFSLIFKGQLTRPV
jgi:hypothetical protein